MEVLSFSNTENFTEGFSHVEVEDPEEVLAFHLLVTRIESELRAAKARYNNGRGQEEVLLPSDLLQSVANNILTAARDEPCGIRGCVLNINYVDESKGAAQMTHIGKVVCDPYSVTTFELSLTLEVRSSWACKLPQFLRNLTSHTAMVISSNYSIAKRQLYCSY